MTASEFGSEQEARRLDILLRSRTRDGDQQRLGHHQQQYHQFKSVSLVNNQNNNHNDKLNLRKQNSNKPNNYENNNSDQEKDSSFSGSEEGERKLSYVGLSCAVSGYSPYTAYSPELTDIPRKVTPPAQIPVAHNPQILDAVLNNYSQMVKPGKFLKPFLKTVISQTYIIQSRLGHRIIFCIIFQIMK